MHSEIADSGSSTDTAHTAPSRQLLVVEDERNIRELICLHLGSEGYICVPTSDGVEALAAVHSQHFDAVILDIMLPGRNGFGVCRLIRQSPLNGEVPILFLSARQAEVDKLHGFDSGADDYLTKPFSMKELSARIGALTRRARRSGGDSAPSLQPVTRGGLVLDPAKRSVICNNARVVVTAHEFKLLYRLAANPGVVFSRERLLFEVWQGEAFVTERSVDTLMRRLRRKVERDPSAPELLLTVWGEGYKFNDA